MKPTPTELALIAAALSKNDGREPKDNLPNAAALIAEAENYLISHTGRARFVAACKIEAPMSLKAFLEMKMPTIKTPSLRQTRFHQFLVADYLPKQTKGQHFAGSIETLATLFINEAKKGGVSAGAYAGLSAWCKAKASAGHAKGAKMMHAKKKAAQLAKQCAENADKKAIEKKSRLQLLPPDKLQGIASKEEKANGKSKLSPPKGRGF